MKTNILQDIEQKMGNIEPGSIRHQILENAKTFKTSWIELGRALYAVLKDKLYKEWGYSSFDIYTIREIGIKKQTAMKLLRSYYFLEKEEPVYLKKDYVEQADTSSIPGYESIDVLRQAKNKKLDEQDYAALKSKIFEKGANVQEIKKDLTAIIKEREEFSPEEARQKKKLAAVKRFISVLKSLKNEIEILKLLPAGIIKEADVLIDKLEAEIE